MDIIEYIHHQMGGMRRQLDMTMRDVTPQQFNWAPPGTANTISATFIHLTATEDHFVQNVLRGEPRVWEADCWGERTGVIKTPDMGESWEAFKHVELNPAPFLEYQKAVWAATDAYLAQLTVEDLERVVSLGEWELCVADVLILAANQALSHSGEIAALKGVQGGKGLPI